MDRGTANPKLLEIWVVWLEGGKTWIKLWLACSLFLQVCFLVKSEQCKGNMPWLPAWAHFQKVTSTFWSIETSQAQRREVPKRESKVSWNCRNGQCDSCPPPLTSGGTRWSPNHILIWTRVFLFAYITICKSHLSVFHFIGTKQIPISPITQGNAFLGGLCVVSCSK